MAPRHTQSRNDRSTSAKPGPSPILSLTIILLVGGPLPGQNAGAGKASSPSVSDATIQTAINRSLAWLEDRQARDGSLPDRHSAEYPGGAEALAALAWLWAGRPGDEAPLAATLAYLSKLEPGMTYTRSLRAMVYSLLEGEDYRRRLAGDVKWLLAGQLESGGWGYGAGSAMSRLHPAWTDGSNSQFALLALREAAEAGMEIPQDTWRRARQYWDSFRNADGGWGYQPPILQGRANRAASYGSMTAAAVASYFIFAEQAGARTAPFADETAGGLKWLADNYDVQRVPKFAWQGESAQLYYYLFTLLRAGQAAGLGRMGGKDYAGDIAGTIGKDTDES